MKFSTIVFTVLGLAAQQTIAAAVAVEGAPLEAISPLEARAVGCFQQGSTSKPAVCSKPNCPAGFRSVFWDFGCPDGSWKCCI